MLLTHMAEKRCLMEKIILFDERLLNAVAGAVALAAVDTGGSRLPLPEKYKI